LKISVVVNERTNACLVKYHAKQAEVISIKHHAKQAEVISIRVEIDRGCH